MTIEELNQCDHGRYGWICGCESPTFYLVFEDGLGELQCSDCGAPVDDLFIIAMEDDDGDSESGDM